MWDEKRIGAGRGGDNDDIGVAPAWEMVRRLRSGFTYRELSRFRPSPRLTHPRSSFPHRPLRHLPGARPAWVALPSPGPNLLSSARQTPPAPPPPPLSRSSLDPASHTGPREERGAGKPVGAGRSLLTGDRERETKAVRYQCGAKAAPSPAEPLTRSLEDYPRPEQPRAGGWRGAAAAPSRYRTPPGDGAGGRRRAELPRRGGSCSLVCRENGSAGGGTVVGNGEGSGGWRKGGGSQETPSIPPPGG